MYVESMVESEGSRWQSSGNCQKFATATYRAENATTAEVYFDNQSGSYGVTGFTRVDGIHAPGDKTFAGSLADNRYADYGVHIEVGVAASLAITNYLAGDGGLVGAMQDLR